MSKKDKTMNGLAKKDVAVSPEKVKLHDFSDEKILVGTEDADRIRAMESEILQAKLQLADKMLQQSDMNRQQSELANLIQVRTSEMLSLVREVATSNGIDPDGGDKKWNLNTNEMIFYRVK